MAKARQKTFRSVFLAAMKWLSSVTLFFAMAYGLIWCFDPAHFPITTVKIIGERHFLSAKALQETTVPYLQAGFFRLKVSSLQQQLLSLPWIKQVEVRKIWPNQLVVKFEEHTPAAFWLNKGIKKGVISQTGTLFFPDMKDVKALNLPSIEGPENKAAQVWQQWLQMGKTLAALNLKITHLSFVARGAWQLRLSNGMTVILGRNDELSRLQAFAKAYELHLKDKQLEIASVDLRYTNGMAVGWRTEPTVEEKVMAVPTVKA
jgi:cell division protein FtsQ